MISDLTPLASLVGLAAFMCSIALLWSVMLRSRAQQWEREQTTREIERQSHRDTFEERVMQEDRALERERWAEEDKHRRALEQKPFELVALSLPLLMQSLKWLQSMRESPEPPPPPCKCGRGDRSAN